MILGAHNLYMMQDMKQVAQPLSRIVRHPQYLGTNNDIALLRLSQPVSYSVIIRPICLPPTSGKIKVLRTYIYFILSLFTEAIHT